MNAEIGHFALILALAVAIFQMIVPMIGAQKGWSGWIDEFGKVRADLNDRTGSIYFRGTETLSVYRDIRWTTQQSFYVRHGDWFVAVCAGLALFGFLVIRTGRPTAPEKSEPDEAEAL